MLIERLGGKCRACGGISHLHFHHADPTKKAFTISTEFDRPMAELIDEVDKCVLLCRECHKKEHGPTHGVTMYSHHKCRCDICKTAWSIKTKEYKRKARQLRRDSTNG